MIIEKSISKRNIEHCPNQFHCLISMYQAYSSTDNQSRKANDFVSSKILVTTVDNHYPIMYKWHDRTTTFPQNIELFSFFLTQGHVRKQSNTDRIDAVKGPSQNRIDTTLVYLQIYIFLFVSLLSGYLYIQRINKLSHQQQRQQLYSTYWRWLV